jgi:hypothetical protein
VKRRAFLAGLATSPLWIRRAFGDVTVTAALLPSTTRSRPTLVLVVPGNDRGRWSRAEAFGHFLTRGSDADLAPLALVDVVCAPAAGDPLMIYLIGNRTRRLDGKSSEIGALIRSVAPASDRPVAELAAIARQRYVKKAPTGARWGHTGVCGATYEEGPADVVDCGMGSLGELGRRFFEFYVRR